MSVTSKKLICICCPKGCEISADLSGDVPIITGNTCKRGYDYAIQEFTNPMRTVTSSIPVIGGTHARCSVKTAAPVPLALVPEVVEIIHSTYGCAPIAIGDIITPDICGTGVALIACRSIAKAKE